MAITEHTTQKRASVPNQETDHYNPTQQNMNVSDNNDNNNNNNKTIYTVLLILQLFYKTILNCPSQ